jgi:surface protein
MFNNCTALTSITIPSSITSIGNGAFSNSMGAMGLTSMTFMHTASDTLTLPTAGSDTGMLYVKTARAMTINHYGNAAVMNYAYATDNITATLVQK